MPRAQQRQHGAARRKQREEKEAAKEQEQQEWDAEFERRRSSRHNFDISQVDEDGAARPQLPPEVRTVFNQLHERIEEMTNAHPEDEDESEERNQLLKAALEALSGHEISAMCDPEPSVLLERLVLSMGDLARRIFTDKLESQFVTLAKDRFASHVLYTLIGSAAETCRREALGDVAVPYVPSGTDVGELPTMTDLVGLIVKELKGSMIDLAYDDCGTHVIRALLLLLGARTDLMDKYRSKKSTYIRSERPRIESFTEDKEHSVPGAPVENETFEKLLKKVTKELASWDDRESALMGSGTRQAASQHAAGPVVAILVELDKNTNHAGSWADRLLGGLISQDHKFSESPETLAGVVEKLASEPTASIVLETAIAKIKPRYLGVMWDSTFANYFDQVAQHPRANFILALMLRRIKVDKFKAAVDEIKTASLQEWVNMRRTTLFTALLERANEENDPDITQKVAQLLGERAFDKENLIVSILSMTSPVPREADVNEAGWITIPGSLVLQSWLATQGNAPVVQGLLYLDDHVTRILATDPAASRVYDSFLQSPTVKHGDRRRLILKFAPLMASLASDKYGSRLVENMWHRADVVVREKIMRDHLAAHNLELLESKYGQFVRKATGLVKYLGNVRAWKQLMIDQVAQQAHVKPQEPSTKKRKVDAVDALFDQFT